MQLAKKKGPVPKEAKCIQRDIIQMVTRGTFQSGSAFDSLSSAAGYEPKYILAYKKQAGNFGVTFFDTQTLKIFIGSFKEEDENILQSFRTLLSQIRPVEVIQERECMSSGIVKMLRNSPIVPTITDIAPNKCYSTHKTKAVLRTKFFDDLHVEKWPKVLQELIAEDEQADCQETIVGSDLALQSFGLAI